MDRFEDVERQHVQLEDNIKKLRASLQHWQTWEIEYESLKEDVLTSEKNGKLPLVGSDSSLLTAKENDSLLWNEEGELRENGQILNLLSHRIDYVQRNITSVASLLKIAENEYSMSQIPSQADLRLEEGLPLTEIYEELDEEGNVISSSTSEPGKAASQIVEALRKAGINELPAINATKRQSTEIVDGVLESQDGPKTDVEDPIITTTESTDTVPSVSSAPSSSDESAKRPKARKTVSFAEDTKADHVTDIKTHATTEMSSQAGANSAKVRSSEPKEDSSGQTSNTTQHGGEEEKPFTAVVPENEEPEDAALREQMINYNMGEVGAIVAELDLDEGNSSDAGDESELDEYDNSSVEDDEDEFGRTKRRVLSDEYLAEMKRLEQRLKNVGPGTTPVATTSLDKEQRARNSMGSQVATKETKAATKKGVRFANDLDIQEAPTETQPKTSTESLPSVAPTESTLDPRKPIFAPTIIERPPSAITDPSSNQEPNEFDPALIQQEVSSTYYRMRNRMIQQRGGFTNLEEENEKGEVPLTEAEGGPKKMSRFKAARLAKLNR